MQKIGDICGLDIELDQKRSAPTARSPEYVGKRFQPVDTRRLDAHAVRETNPIELGPCEIDRVRDAIDGTRPRPRAMRGIWVDLFSIAPLACATLCAASRLRAHASRSGRNGPGPGIGRARAFLQRVRTNFWNDCGVKGAKRSIAPDALTTSPT